MALSEMLLGEFTQEAKSTRRLLERVPEDKLAWQPHEKSMSLSRLAGHVAEIAGWTPRVVAQDEIDFEESDYQPFVPETTAEILGALDESVEKFNAALDGVSDEDLMRPWTLRNGEHVIMTAPKFAALRSFVLSHLVHHRGQLTVYLRQLDVELPGIYGPSADERGGF